MQDCTWDTPLYFQKVIDVRNLICKNCCYKLKVPQKVNLRIGNSHKTRRLDDFLKCWHNHKLTWSQVLTMLTYSQELLSYLNLPTAATAIQNKFSNSFHCLNFLYWIIREYGNLFINKRRKHLHQRGICILIESSHHNICSICPGGSNLDSRSKIARFRTSSSQIPRPSFCKFLESMQDELSKFCCEKQG